MLDTGILRKKVTPNKEDMEKNYKYFNVDWIYTLFDL